MNEQIGKLINKHIIYISKSALIATEENGNEIEAHGGPCADRNHVIIIAVIIIIVDSSVRGRAEVCGGLYETWGQGAGEVNT